MRNEIEYIAGDLLDRVALVGTPLNADLYDGGLYALEACILPGRGRLSPGEHGVTFLAMNRTAEFFFTGRGHQMEVTINSRAGIFPTFPLPQAQMSKPIQGVLLDLDGTCIKSEAFWIRTILDTTNIARERCGIEPLEGFLEKELPHISGRTVPEHLMYCIENYCPGFPLGALQEIYTRLAEEYIVKCNSGEDAFDAFEPAEGLKELLLALKEQGIKIALVTSGLYYKAWPEVEQAMEKMNLGDATTFFDAIITSGTLAGPGQCGTMGNAIAKPWPNIYFEAAQALGFTMETSAHFVGVGDSNADAVAVRLMGSPFIGIKGGNIAEGATQAMCSHFVDGLPELLDVLRKFF